MNFKKLCNVAMSAIALTLVSAQASAALVDENLAAGKVAYASTEQGTNTAASAFDGNAGTRWESSAAENQWIYVDLGTSVELDHVVLNWEGAYARHYQVCVAEELTDEMLANLTDDDETNNFSTGWEIVADKTCESYEQNQSLAEVAGKLGRYVAINCIERGTTWGFSLFEIEVYARALASAYVTIACDNTFGTSNDSYTFTLTAQNQDGSPMDTAEVVWNVTDSEGVPADYVIDENLAMTFAAKGTYTVTATVGGVTSNPVDVQVVTDSPNLSDTTLPGNENVTATAIETTDAGSSPMNAIDGNTGNEWYVPDVPGAGQVYDAWIVIDLGGKKKIDCIHILWEASASAEYTVSGSDDGTEWHEIVSHADPTAVVGVNRNDWFYDLDEECRYVRVYSTKAALSYGIKMHEISIYGTTSGTSGVSTAVEREGNIYADDNLLVLPGQMPQVFVYATNGLLVAEAEDVSRMDISGLAHGVYVVLATDAEGEVLTAKIAK